jgi:hypothetical protein
MKVLNHIFVRTIFAVTIFEVVLFFVTCAFITPVLLIVLFINQNIGRYAIVWYVVYMDNLKWRLDLSSEYCEKYSLF